MSKAPISDFQKSFLAKAGMKVFTEKEFAEQIEFAKDEIMAMAIDAAKQAVLIERELCAELMDKMELPLAAEAIRTRTNKK